MDFHHPLEGSFFLCPQCNKVDYPLFPLFSKAGKDKDSAPRKDIHKDKSIKITKEDIEGDLNEGRD